MTCTADTAPAGFDRTGGDSQHTCVAGACRLDSVALGFGHSPADYPFQRLDVALQARPDRRTLPAVVYDTQAHSTQLPSDDPTARPRCKPRAGCPFLGVSWNRYCRGWRLEGESVLPSRTNQLLETPAVAYPSCVVVGAGEAGIASPVVVEPLQLDGLDAGAFKRKYPPDRRPVDLPEAMAA